MDSPRCRRSWRHISQAIRHERQALLSGSVSLQSGMRSRGRSLEEGYQQLLPEVSRYATQQRGCRRQRTPPPHCRCSHRPLRGPLVNRLMSRDRVR